MVAEEIKRDKREVMFAATPPLEAKKALLSLLASTPERCLGFIDVGRAYLHSKARRDVCVDLPEEDYQEKMCGKFKKAMHGAKDAAQNWELEHTEMMVEVGSTQGSHGARAFLPQGEGHWNCCT